MACKSFSEYNIIGKEIFFEILTRVILIFHIVVYALSSVVYFLFVCCFWIIYQCWDFLVVENIWMM